uniref:Apple domain-containing protein n=2 Tax=Clytia hemisphaerica TaxID=252671 RepID=A0A7M5WRW5_9CNID
MSPKLIFVILILIQASSNNGRIVRNKIIESPNGTKIKIQYIVMTGFNNKKLQGPTSIQTTMVKSVSHCKAECIRVNSCISFNIFPAGSFFDCQLFDTDHYIDQQILTDQTGYQYFVIKSNCSVGDPNLKCPNEFTYCKPNYDTDTSTCECRFPGCLDPVVYTCTPGPTINDTDGGWLLIGNITLNDQNQIGSVYDTYIANPPSLHQIQPTQNEQFLLNHNNVQSLFQSHGYSEVRVKCFKPWHGRTLDAVLYGTKTYQFINREQNVITGMCGNVRFLEN